MKTKYYVANISGGKDSMAMFYQIIFLLPLKEFAKILNIPYYKLDEVICFDTGWEFDCIYKNIEVVQAICSEHKGICDECKHSKYLYRCERINEDATNHT